MGYTRVEYDTHYLVSGRFPEDNMVVFLGEFMLRACLLILGHLGHGNTSLQSENQERSVTC